MKKIFFIPLLLMFSCTTIKQISNQKITTITNCKSVEMNSKMIYYKVKIDNNEQTLLFDTGATMSVITDSTSITDIENKKFGNFIITESKLKNEASSNIIFSIFIFIVFVY